MRDYYIKNREKCKAYGRNYYYQHKEQVKKYLLKNKEKIREYNKQYSLKNKEKKKEAPPCRGEIPVAAAASEPLRIINAAATLNNKEMG